MGPVKDAPRFGDSTVEKFNIRSKIAQHLTRSLITSIAYLIRRIIFGHWPYVVSQHKRRLDDAPQCEHGAGKLNLKFEKWRFLKKLLKISKFTDIRYPTFLLFQRREHPDNSSYRVAGLGDPEIGAHRCDRCSTKRSPTHRCKQTVTYHRTKNWTNWDFFEYYVVKCVGNIRLTFTF